MVHKNRYSLLKDFLLPLFLFSTTLNKFCYGGAITLPGCAIGTTENAGTTTTTCSVGGSAMPTNNVCTYSKKIYKGKTNGECTVAYGKYDRDEGLRIFTISGNAAVEITSTSKYISSLGAAPTLAMFDCGYGECEQSYGYVNDDEVALEIAPETVTPAPTTTVDCEETGDMSNMGKVVYISRTLSACALKEINITDHPNPSITTASIDAFPTIVSGGGNKHFIMKPAATPVAGTFAKAPYTNFGLLKVEDNKMAISKRSPRLPVCSSDNCKLENSSTAISSGQVCISSDSKTIYKMDGSCKVIGGDDGSNGISGIKIFKKGTKFNEYTDVTESLTSVSPNSGEMTPFFVIYDCSPEGCIQTSGIVKYGASGSETFMNCYTQYTLNKSDDTDIDVLDVNGSALGCIKLNKDESNTECDNNLAKATTGICKYNPTTGIFNMCANLKTGIAGTDADYTMVDISMKIGETSQFLFTSGKTPFANTEKDGKALLKINKNSAVLARNIPKGFQYNYNTIKTGADAGKDGLIQCSGVNKLSTCETVDLSSGYENPKYYIDSTTQRLISCVTDGCTLRNASIKGYFLSSMGTTGKNIISCDGSKCVEVNNVETCDGGGSGTIKYSSSKMLMCTDSGEIPVTEATDTISYEEITVDANKFPGYTTSKKINVRVSKSDQSVTLVADASLPSCSTCNNASKFCISTDNKIKSGTSGTCSEITGPASSSSVLFFKYDGSEIKEPTHFFAVPDMAYHCTFGADTKVSSCSLIKGYAFANDVIVSCSGVLGDSCIIGEKKSSAAPCDSGTIEGNVVNAETLCIKAHSITLPTGTDVHTIGFKLKDGSDVYTGKNKNDYVFLKVSSGFAMLIDDPTSGIFSDLGTYDTSGYTKLIKCDSNGCSQLIPQDKDYYMDQSILKGTKPTHVIECKDSSGVKCSSIEGSQLKGNGYIDAETTTTTSLNVISCTEEGCTSTKKSIVSGNSIYFINAPDITKVVKCTNTASTINCDLTTNPAYAGAIVRELFVDGLVSGNTITCISSSTQGCISSKALPYCTNANDDSGKCTTGTPIADDSYCIKPDGKIYKSSIIPQSRKRSPTHQCTVVDANKNYLFKTSDNKLGTFGTDSGIIYNCIAGSICTQVISSSIFDDNTHKEYLYTCNDNGICTGKASDIQPGSYIAGAPTLSNNNPRVSYNYIINCQVSVAANCTSTLIADSAEKYYDDALISENLIHCNGSNQCISKNPGGSEAEPYHYLDNANSLNIITCTGASCSSQPGSRVQDNAYIDATTTKKILVYGTKMVQDNGPQSKSMIDGSNPKLVITGDGSKNVVISDKSTLEGYEFLTAGTDYYTITCTSAGCISSKIGIGLCKDVKDNNYGKCKNPSGEDVADGFYISTNGKIYESKTSGPSCKAIALNKTYLFVGTSVVVLDEDYVGNDGDKPIYRCNDATCSQLIGSTILIKDGDTPKYAYTCNADGDACSKTTVVEGYYLAGLPTVAEGKILYDLMQCTEADDITSCAMITPEDGYYTDVEKNLLLCKDGQCYKPPTPNLGYYVHAAPDATDPLEEALIVCSKPAVAIECVVESAKVGYYLNQGEDILTNQLIHCTSEGCATDQANEGYYINNESSDSAHPDYITHVIKCQHSGFNCATMAHAGSGTQVTHYLSGDTKQVITCSLNSCELERITTKGYFLNSGDLLADAKTIRCTGTGDSPCTNILDADLGGSAIGKVKKELSDLKFCLDSDCDPNYELKNDVLTTTYKTITIAAANDFPSITTQNTIITVKLGAGAAILMEESGLPACLESIPSTDVCYTGALKGQYCFHATSKKIYQSVVGQDGSKSCIAITGNGDEAPLFYFTLSTGKKLDQLENTNADVVAYQCTFSSSTLSGCELFKGYTLVGSNTIHCNGWLGNGCEVTPVGSLSDSCSGGEGGLVKTKLSLCFKTFKLVLPTKEEDVKTITFLATGGNMEYGKNEGEIVFLSVSSRMVKVISAPKPSTDQYYFNQLVANTSNKNAMIKCNSSGCSAVKFSSSGADDFVGKNAIIDAGDPNSKTLIYQKSNSYTYNDRTSDIENGTLYFVNELDQSKLIVCTKASGCKAEAGSITPGHAYIDETPISSSFKTIIITCENGGSGSVCTANDRSGDLSTSDLFYIDGKETDKVIICNSTTKCKSSKGSIANGHAYISSKDEDKKTIITCNTTQGCTTKSLSSELVGDKKKYYICGHDITHLIECTASGCEIESSARESGTEIDGINEERTIICSEYGCISSTAIASACENDIAESTTSLCKDSQNQVINENYFCFDTGSNKIFKSTSETKKCKDQTEDVFLEKTADSKYKEGVWGTTPNGLIYQCNGSRCQQVISSYYLGKKGQDKYLYKCDDSGSCDIVNRISVGFYLSGEPIVGSTLKYTQMIQCTEPLGEKCGKVGVIGEGYYIDAGSPGNIIYCEDDGEGNKQCSTGKAETDQGFAYVDQGTASSGVSKSVITCDEEKCVSSEKSKLIEHPKKLYFISATDTKKLITCQYGEEVGGVRPFSCETDGEDASANTALLDGSDANYTIRCDGENPCESKIECRVNTGANCDAGKYYNVADSTQSILEVREDQNGDLFYCKEDSEKESGVGCSLIENAGYYINSNSEIFTCKGTTLKCQKNSIDSNSCSSETNISQLFIDNNNKINLCVHHDGTTAYPTLLSSTEKTFLVEYEPSTNEFKHEGTKYAFAKVSENSVIMDKNYNFTKNNHVYVNVKTKAVLVEGQCPAHTGSPLTTVVEEHDCDTTKYICDPSA